MRAGIELAAGCGDFSQLSRGYVNLADLLQNAGDLLESESLMLQARDLAQRRGHAPGIRFVDGNLIDCDFARGRWKAAEERARAFLATSGAEGHYMDNIALSTVSILELARESSNRRCTVPWPMSGTLAASES